MNASPRRPGALVLEDGTTYPGWLFGADLESVTGEPGRRPGEGEVVFNTCMTGYQEILTDPSYTGQMIVMTYPMIGNYGTNPADPESGRVWARALVVRECADDYSNWRAQGSVEALLRDAGVPGLTGVDTRSLTRHLRSTGSRRAVVAALERPFDPREPRSQAEVEALVARSHRVTPIEEQDLVVQSACTEPFEWDEGLAPVYVRKIEQNLRGRTIVVVDYGVKRNILRSLVSRQARVLVVPPASTVEDILAASPDGVLLSNGPGDPAFLAPQVEVVRGLFGRVPVLGICLGHQLIGRAAGADTGRLPFGHHGGNHPVQDQETGEVHITSQNHEFQVIGDSLRQESGFVARQRNLNDGSVEGLSHRDLPILSVQYHPEGAPGPHDNQYVFDRFADMIRSGEPPAIGPQSVRLRNQRAERAAEAPDAPSVAPAPRKVLVIGSGPIIIGQAAEFDYAGTQACKALREEGIETVLVNSNPATIMTEPGVADRTYIEPLTVEVIERIIAREKPDGLLPTLGGQTGLNLAVALCDAGVLERHNVRLLGTPLETIRKAEDREAFKQFLVSIDEPVTESRTVETLEQARAFVAEVGLPLVVRPAYTLGGTGGGFIHEAAEFDDAVRRGLDASPITQVLLERSLVGWKEIEYEVMRDSVDTCITVCNMENLDAMGVHTGDSIVVAPSQTLSDKEYQMLRSSALKIIRGLGIEGGCNVQYALDPDSFQYYVIEVNPRVSRSSALASKATGYPIARVAAKVAIGKRLDEIPNQVTGKTLAAFEPALDYCVVKIPRWPFDKFPTADRSIGTQMKATGEVMAIERTFEAALMKAIRSLEQKVPALDSAPVDDRLLSEPNDQRLFALLAALRQRLGDDGAGHDRVIDQLHGLTSIDAWFLRRLARIVGIERSLRAGLEPEVLRVAKTAGFTDRAIAGLSGESIEDVRAAGFEAGVRVAYKLVDTCAAEFTAATPYYYSTYEAEDESPRGQRQQGENPSVLVLGSGPIRIGQGIEFDYCSVQAALALREGGWSSAMLNSNPETVSTDFDTSDRLYFDPLDEESAENVLRAESARGVVVQFGGQTAINLAEPLARRGAKILGSSVDAIDLAEDRRRFEATLREIGIPQPPGATATSVEEARAIADRVGYPVLVRPSYVLGGRAMEIVHAEEDLERYLEGAREALGRGTILVDKYLVGGEFEVDAISDGERVLIPGIMEHVERAGVHSGDSFAVYPAQHLTPSEVEQLVDYTRRIALRLNIIGLLNIQYVLHRNRIYVIEVNPRSSRTVPFLSKVTAVPMVPVAMAVMMGRSLADQGYEDGLWPASQAIAVKAPVFSMSKLLEVDSQLGPEMKSTGEVMGIDTHLAPAMYKAFLGSFDRLPTRGVVLCTIADGDKAEALPIIARLVEMGFTVQATRGTARALRQAGISVTEVQKITEGSPHVVDLINSGAVDLVINTISNETFPGRANADGSRVAIRDGFEIRRAAVERRIPCLTSLDTAAALVESLNLLALDGAFEVMTVDEYLRGPVVKPVAGAAQPLAETAPEEAML